MVDMITTIAELSSTLDAASQVVEESRQRLQAHIPEFLYHYTNSSGMRGILDSSRIWATNFRFLNDASEVEYGVALFDEVVQERLNKTKDTNFSEFLKQTLHEAKEYNGTLDCYIACFCERDDLLNQWRVYAGSGGGYALGFRTEDIGIDWDKSCHPQHDFTLHKVIYDKELQKKLITEILDLGENCLSRASEGVPQPYVDSLISLCAYHIALDSVDYLMYFKHPAFAVEEEWRLCHVTMADYEKFVLFRDGPYGLTPYVCLDPSPMTGVHANRLPLERITHGPTPNPANVRFALTKLLQAKGYGSVEIGGSVLPVRVAG